MTHVQNSICQDADRLDAIGCFWCFRQMDLFPQSYESLQESCAAQLTVPPRSGLNLSSKLSVSLGFTVPLRRPLHTPADDAGYAETAIHIFTISSSTFATDLRPRLARNWGTSRHQVVSASHHHDHEEKFIRPQLLDSLHPLTKSMKENMNAGCYFIHLKISVIYFNMQILQLFSIFPIGNAGSPFCVL